MILKRRNFSVEKQLVLLGKSKKSLKDSLTVRDPNVSDEVAKKALNRSSLRRAAVAIPTLGALGSLYAISKGKTSKSAIAKSALLYGGGLGGLMVGIGRLGMKTDRAMMKRGDYYPDTKRIKRQNDIRRVALGEMTKEEFDKKWHN
jgi:hypothetical protein